jgi:hypothetical protein
MVIFSSNGDILTSLLKLEVVKAAGVWIKIMKPARWMRFCEYVGMLIFKGD